jgi:hypothetical protein
MLVRYREARSLPRLPHEDTAYTMHILQVTNHAPCLPPSARSASLVTPNHPEHERHLPKQVIGPVRYGVARGGDSGGTAPGLCRILDMNSGENPQGEVRKGYRTGSLARIKVFGLLHAVLERKAGEGFFCGVGAQPCPLFFGDPEGSFYPRFPLRRPREDILRFLVEALRSHHFILAQGAWPRS